MEVRKGFKQTDVGVIPEDWDIQLLNDLSEKIMVGIASAATHAYRSQGIPLLRNQNIKQGYLQDDDLLYIDERYETVYRNKRLKTGDLLTTRTAAGYPGITCVIPPEYDGAQSFTTIITRPKKDGVDTNYLCNYINSSYGVVFFERSKIGGGQKNIGVGIIKKMPIPIPPLQEQKLIANALRDVDALLNSLDALIAKKRLIKQGAMQELLTGKKRLPGFSVEWETVQLNDCLDLLTDFEANGSFADVAENVHVYNTENFAWYVRATDLENDTPMSTVRYVDKGTYNFLQKTSLFGGEVLITKRGEIGKVYLFKSKNSFATLGPNLYLLKLNSKVIPYYIYLYFKYGPGNISLTKNDASTTLGALYKNDVKSILMNLPSIPEQTAIAEILSDMDAEISALEQKREKTRLLKQGMMQELLTGRIRLV